MKPKFSVGDKARLKAGMISNGESFKLGTPVEILRVIQSGEAFAYRIRFPGDAETSVGESELKA